MSRRLTLRFVLIFLVLGLMPGKIRGDGKVIRPREYNGSLEEKSQEAIIIFEENQVAGMATEDLILKINVVGSAEKFAWVIPFPNVPAVKKEAPELFAELFQYVESRVSRGNRKFKTESELASEASGDRDAKNVEVLSHSVVGDFEIFTVREKASGGLNPWLEKEGFQALENAEDVIGFYRDKDYVFCCIKVKSRALAREEKIDSHPLRFTFQTGGRDGIYFPMKMTGLQQEKFDLNLYVFYRYWLNDNLNEFGFENRGLKLYFRDFDSRDCIANGGKNYSNPEQDPYLARYAGKIQSVTRLFQKLHPGQKYYLTNIKARNLRPQEVREWSDDLWLFPYYTDLNKVPTDVEDNGPASGAWQKYSKKNTDPAGIGGRSSRIGVWMVAILGLLILTAVIVYKRSVEQHNEPQ